MTSHGHLEVLGHARQFHLKSHFEDEEIHKFAERPHLRVASSYICKFLCQESQVSRKQRGEWIFFLLDENQDKDRKDDDNSRRMTAE